ncbi:MAG: DUF2184 domain-containing protein [Methylomicrobium sp.]|nr:DUF2184 domain-containing protein [Methylomicrobium sp.]
MPKYLHLDSQQSVFLERELEQVKSRSFDVLKAPLSANRLIPIDSTTSPGANVVTYKQFDGNGIAKIISNYADDLPTVNIEGKSFTSMLKSIGNSFVYSLEDIRAAMFAGLPLQQRIANQAVRAHQELMNRLAFFGDDEHGIQGWLTNVNIPSATVVDGEDAASEWSTKKPDEILADLTSAKASIITLTKGTETPNTLVLPLAQYEIIQSTARTGNSDTTIAEFFLRTNPGFTIEYAPELEGAFPGDTDGFIMYDRSPDKLWQEVPQLVEMFPPQERNLAFTVPVHSKHGGTIIPYPLSMVFRYGI